MPGPLKTRALSGRMDRRRFFTWSAVGAALWVGIVTLLSYALGQALPTLQDKLVIAVLLIAAVSLLPVAFQWWRHRRTRSAHPDAPYDPPD